MNSHSETWSERAIYAISAKFAVCSEQWIPSQILMLATVLALGGLLEFLLLYTAPLLAGS